MPNFSTILGSKKKNGKRLLPLRISEDHELQAFENSQNSDEVDDLPPCEPRFRSMSVIESGLSSPLIQKNQLLLAAQSDSSELLLSNIESLPKAYRRSNRRLGRLNTQLLEAVKSSNYLECQKLLKAGANPNATCQINSVSAVHLAAMSCDKILQLLLEHLAEKQRTDELGRTPLHLAAWAGNLFNIGLLLGFPKEILNKLALGSHDKILAKETEEEIMKLTPALKDFVNTRCELGETSRKVPKDWIDNIEHNCSSIGENLPCILLGWTPLHAASCSARASSVRLLLAAGAEPCTRDAISRSPLDVAGYAYYRKNNNEKQKSTGIPNCAEFTEVIHILLSSEGISLRMQKKDNMDTPLHTAVELESLDAIVMLLRAGACPRSLSRLGQTPMHLCVQKRLKAHLQSFFIFIGYQTDNSRESIADVTDKDGFSVLHQAVLHGWFDGVCLALEAGANVISKASNGETPLHSAAAIGNLEILKEILLFCSPFGIIDSTNKFRETALIITVKKGHKECAKLLLNQGASITKILPRNLNVIHIASKLGHLDILKVLLDYDYTNTRVMVNHLCSTDRGYGPLHYAAENNHPECFKLLLSKNAYVNLKSNWCIHKGATPIHVAAKTNNVEIAKIILKFDKTTLNKENVDAFGWTPLHIASYYGCKDIITLLLNEGADLSTQTNVNNTKKTPIELMMNHLTKPTEFLEEIFDSCITSTHLNPNDPYRKVIVDYGILVPGKRQEMDCNMEMTVIEALLRTGNRAGQRRLLIHPLIESFICLKWKALLPFFYTMLLFYGIFSISLTSYVLSVFYYSDRHKLRPMWLDTNALKYSVYVSVALTVFLESIYLNISKQYFREYLLRIESWIKFGSLTLGTTLLIVLKTESVAEDWERHLATMAVLLCWLEMTLLLSRFPKCGYYVLMFGKVSTNVLKILLTFTFLIAGFALCFMLEFKSATPFDSPWAALVKTMVMMTSEFDYDDLVDKKNQQLVQSYNTIRLIFLIFLFLAAIVLMNLMVGVAVNDLNDLEVFGNIMRLEKQVEFLASLESLTMTKIFMKIMPKRMQFTLTFDTSITLRPSKLSCSYYKAIPSRMREVIFEKAQRKKNEKAGQIDCENLYREIRGMHEAMTKLVTSSDRRQPSRRESDGGGGFTRYEMELTVMQMKNQIDVLSNKVEKILNRCQ